MLAKSESVKIRPNMKATALYFAPESGDLVERNFDLWREEHRKNFFRLIQWAVCNKIEVRVRHY
jgi:hypothetical protein